ncbi:MAG: SDR family oxidoreductase [Formivibrio sp.]|nr:SDR family oxidoreductase [Formivibrio sp.]
MGQSVFITGARGYLGGRLVKGLAAKGDVQLTGGTRERQPIVPLGWPAECDLVYLDPLAQSEDEIARTVRGSDVIIHLAAPNEILSAQKPVEALMAGGVASLKLLRAAQAAGCGRFIFLSTIHVYGSPLKGRICETDAAKPLHPYAITHRTAEDYVLAAMAKREIEGIVLRLSNGIGAPAWASVDRWSLIGNDLCRQAVVDNHIVLRSSGLQYRDFITLHDFVEALILMTRAPREVLGDGLFNLGGSLPLRMIDVAELIARRASLMLGKDIVVQREAPAIGEEHPTIDYSIDRISAAGFVPSSHECLVREVDATLALCCSASRSSMVS